MAPDLVRSHEQLNFKMVRNVVVHALRVAGDETWRTARWGRNQCRRGLERRAGILTRVGHIREVDLPGSKPLCVGGEGGVGTRYHETCTEVGSLRQAEYISSM
jgi:hypothetical protein